MLYTLFRHILNINSKTINYDMMDDLNDEAEFDNDKYCVKIKTQ